jgi:hypothetical protein
MIQFFNTGQLPREILKQDFVTIVTSLVACSKITTETLVWAESRRDAILALESIFKLQKFVPDSVIKLKLGIGIMPWMNPDYVSGQCILC